MTAVRLKVLVGCERSRVVAQASDLFTPPAREAA